MLHYVRTNRRWAASRVACGGRLLILLCIPSSSDMFSISRLCSFTATRQQACVRYRIEWSQHRYKLIV